MFPRWRKAFCRIIRLFDFLITGEGEVTMSELAAGFDLAEIKGLIWRRGSEVITNDPRPKNIPI